MYVDPIRLRLNRQSLLCHLFRMKAHFLRQNSKLSVSRGRESALDGLVEDGYDINQRTGYWVMSFGEVGGGYLPE